MNTLALCTMALSHCNYVTGPTSQELVQMWASRDSSLVSADFSSIASVRPEQGRDSITKYQYSGFGPDRRWYGVSIHNVVSDGRPMAYGDIRGYVNDRVYGVSLETGSGVVRDDDNVSRSATDSLAFVLGWAFDNYSCTPLSHLIENSVILEVARASPDTQTEHPGVLARVALLDGIVPAHVAVRFDPSHDYAPSMIEIRHSCLNHVQWRITVTDWTQIADIWMPASAYVEVGTFTMSPEQGAALQTALKDAGLAERHDGMDPKVIEIYRRVVPEIFGSDAVPSHISTTVQLNFEYLRLNQRVPESRFAPALSGDFDVFDGFTGNWCNPTKSQ